MNRVRTAIVAIAVCLGGLLVATGTTTTADAAGAYCAYTGLNKATWDGGGDGTTWDQAANWNPNVVPGTTPGGGTTYICIDNATITMNSNRAEAVAIDIRNSTVTLLNNSQIFVYGSQSTRASTIRANATVVMSGSNALGGVGRIDLLGTLRVTSSGGFANTLISRVCGITNSCGTPISGPPGLLVVGNAANLNIDGGGPGPTDLGGVNLKDQYQIDVTGTMRLSNRGFISADYGTRTRLLPKTGGSGRLLITNDGGYYEGSSLYGLSTLSTFVNNGQISKTAGTGTSVITATYSSTGSVSVQSGTVVLPDGPTTAATLGAGDAIGSGLCQTGASTLACQPVASPADQQIAKVQLASTDTDGGTVAFSLIAPSGAADIGNPLDVNATGVQASAANPALLSIRYDASLLGGKQLANLTISRKVGSAAYVVVQPCQSNGNPPSGQTACVDRRGLATSSQNLPDGDVLVVVRTQGFSRWRAR